MNSGTTTLSNAPPRTASSHHSASAQRYQPTRSPSDRHPSLRTSKSPSPAGVKKSVSPPTRRLNGNFHPSSDPVTGENLSDAETDIFSSDEPSKVKRKKHVVKHEHRDVSDASSPPGVVRAEPGDASSRARSANGDVPRKKRERTNGQNRSEGGEEKSAVKPKKRPLSGDAPSSSSRAQSADASTSTSDPNGRSRQAQSAEPRKRKFCEDAHRPSDAERPQQRPRLDQNGSGSTNSKNRPISPIAPATPGVHGHKRSASTQSSLPTVNSSVQSRNRREASATTVASDHKEWNSNNHKEWNSNTSSEEDDSSSHYPPIPNLAPARSNRSSQRALNSPSRVMPKRADKYGTTPLARACVRGRFDDVKAAYEEAPGELDQTDHGGFAPLQKAALYGHAEIVQFLLDKGCRRDCFSKDEHDTPLIDAVENGHVDVVKILLEGGVKPHHQNKNGKRAIDAVANDEDWADEMKALIQKAMADYVGQDSDDDEKHESPVATKQSRQRTDLLYLEMNVKNLLDYSRKGDVEAVGHFLSSVKPNNACAVAAARGGHFEVLNLLLASDSDRLEKDPDPANYDETPLIAAIGRGHLKIIRLLLDQDNFNPARKTKDGKTYFELAEEMRGPKWQLESELLRDRYDAHMVRRKAAAAKKRKLQEANNSADQGSGATTETGPPKPTKKRLLARKDFQPKDPKRRSRVVESSQSEGSDDEVRVTKAQILKRKLSIASSNDRPSSPIESRLVSSTRPRSSTDPRSEKSLGKMPILKRPIHTGTASAPGEKGTDPAKQGTPELLREDRLRQAAAKAAAEEEEANAAEAESVIREAELLAVREAARKAEEARKAEQARKAEESRKAEEAKKAQEEARSAEEERLRLEKDRERRDREARLETLPNGLKNAAIKGPNRPLVLGTTTTSTRGQEMGIGWQFLPIHIFKLKDLDEMCSSERKEEQWMMSFQAAGILGLPSELHLSEYPNWERRPVTDKQRVVFLKWYDLHLLAQDYLWIQPGHKGHDHIAIRNAMQETKTKFLQMEPLVWIKYDDFVQAFKGFSHLAGLKLTTSTSGRITEGPRLPSLFD